MARTPEKWEVEDGAFWDSTGRPIAKRNLCVMEKWTSTWVGERGNARHVHDTQNHNENVCTVGGN